jgi:hypothetical protein
MLAYEFDETTANGPSITGLGTYYASEFSENVGIATTMTANIFPPYDIVYDEFAGVLYGPGQGRYMRQNTDKSVIVYNEIDEIGFNPSGVIIPSTTSVNEGSSVIFNVISTNVESGTTLYYNISGSVGIASTDFANSSLSGSLSVSGTFDLGYGSTTLTLANDFITEGTETFNMNLRTGSISGPIVTTSPTITISDTSNASSIITSGLVMNLDAGNASSYPGSGTTWYDLSGSGNDGTLTLGPTYSSANGGSIVFDGVNDYISFNNLTTSSLGLTSANGATLICWAKITLLTRFTGVFTFWSAADNVDFGWDIINSTNNLRIWKNTTQTLTGVSLTPYSTLWTQYALVSNSSGTIFYINQNQIATTSTSGNIITTGGRNLMFGDHWDNPIQGNSSNIQIYNRALTAAEVSQNFNALKGRFGL